MLSIIMAPVVLSPGHVRGSLLPNGSRCLLYETLIEHSCNRYVGLCIVQVQIVVVQLVQACSGCGGRATFPL